MNVNEHKQLAQRVRGNPDLLADIIGSAMDAIIAVDDAQRIVLFNAAAEKIFACPANEAIGDSVERFIPQRFRAGHSERVRRFAESGITNRTFHGLGTLWGLRATGEEFPIEASISKVESGGKNFFTVVIRDITERHRAEDAVRESEQRFQLVADAASVLMWMSGTDKLCTYFNTPWLDFTGRTIEEELGNGWAEGVHPDDLPRCLQTYTECFDRREEFRMEYRLRRHDGEYRWVLDIGKPRFNQDRSFAGYIGIGIDVTERKLEEEARVQLAAIVESSEDAIASGMLDGTIVSWNAGAERMYGYTGAEAIGKSITILIPPELSDEEKKILETVRAGGRIEHFETIRVTKTGKRINISLTISPIKDSSGRVVGVSGIARDINERKRAEEALRKAEERLRLAQWAAHIGTFDVNIRTGVDIWQPETEALYGLPPGSFRGTLTAFEDLIHPQDRERIIALTQEMVRTGQPAEGEWRVVWPDGSVHWIAGRGQVLRDGSGEPSRMLGVNLDITDRKQAEQELARANERFHLAIESGSVGGWDYDLKTGENVWFGKAHAQLGMAPDETLGSRQEFLDHVHEDDREHLRHAIQIAKDKHEEFTEDFRVIWRDGTTHWLRSRGGYHYGANGEPERMLGISLDITQSKQDEQALRESEQRLRLATQAGRMYAYDWDVTADVVVRSSEHVEILGLTGPLHLPQQQFVDKIYPDDRPRFLAAVAGLTPENPTAEATYRVLAPDGTLRWLKSNGRGFFDAEGRLVRVIGMVADATDQKLAEEALSNISRKLVDAQEQERARVARELHDDINQRLAMLAVELEQLQDNPSDVTSRLQELRKRTTEISNGVQALSHDLHSSQLEYLGAVAGMKSWCKEFGERGGIQIDFRHDVRSALPQEVGLCLFRVVQEALHNATKHSGVKWIDVQLHEGSGEIDLIVSDSGRGFDVEAVKQGKGLGLTSMHERVRLVNGTIAIDSKLMGGTTIHVRVPFRSEKVSERAAG